MKEIFRLHNVPKVVILDTHGKFIGNFWKDLFIGLRTQLKFRTPYHPETDEQIEIVNKIVEDMLRMYVMDKPSMLEDYLHLV